MELDLFGGCDKARISFPSGQRQRGEVLMWEKLYMSYWGHALSNAFASLDIWRLTCAQEVQREVIWGWVENQDSLPKRGKFWTKHPLEIDSGHGNTKVLMAASQTPQNTHVVFWSQLKIQTCTQADTRAQSVRPTVTAEGSTGIPDFLTSITHNQTTPGSFPSPPKWPILPQAAQKSGSLVLKPHHCRSAGESDL